MLKVKKKYITHQICVEHKIKFLKKRLKKISRKETQTYFSDS